MAVEVDMTPEKCHHGTYLSKQPHPYQCTQTASYRVARQAWPWSTFSVPWWRRRTGKNEGFNNAHLSKEMSKCNPGKLTRVGVELVPLASLARILQRTAGSVQAFFFPLSLSKSRVKGNSKSTATFLGGVSTRDNLVKNLWIQRKFFSKEIVE